MCSLLPMYQSLSSYVCGGVENTRLPFSVALHGLHDTYLVFGLFVDERNSQRLLTGFAQAP
jgi:hypothetical protein